MSFDEGMRMLYSADPVMRRKGIVLVANSGNPQTLKTLEEFLSREDDRAVRDVASKAMQYVQKEQWRQAEQGQAVTSAPVSPTAMVTSGTNKLAATSTPVADRPATPVLVKPPAASPQQIKLAQQKVNAALTLQNVGKNQEAAVLLKNALRLNPELSKDTFTMGLVFSATGLTGNEAIEYLASAEEKGATVKVVQTGMTTIMLFALQIAALALGTALFLALFYGKLLSIIPESAIPVDLATRASVLRNPLNLFVLFIPVGISTTIATLVPSFMIYVAGLLIGGSGGVARFMQWITLSYIGTYAVLAFMVVLIPVSIFNDPEQAFAALGAIGALTFVGFIVQCYVAGRAHFVGFWKGLAMTFLGSFLTGCLYGFIGQQLALRAMGQ